MKKIYLFATAMAFSYCSFAQQRVAVNVTHPHGDYSTAQKVLTPTDTLFGWLTGGGTPAVYSIGTGDYVAGTNQYGDKNKVQQFNVTNQYNVEGAVVWVGIKGPGGSTGDPNSKITVNIYNIDNFGYNSTGTWTAAAPGTIVSGVDVLWDNIDTSATGAGGFVNVTFTAPFLATSTYGIGVDLTSLASTDKLGLVTSTSGDAGGTEMAWEAWSDDTMHTMYSAWTSGGNPLDVDLGIFPIVDVSVGVEEINSINGIKLFQNQPNPFKGESVVNYELDNNAKDVKIFVLDINGKLVKTYEQGAQNAGKYYISLSSTDFSDGVYYFAIQADSHRLAKKMTVVK